MKLFIEFHSIINIVYRKIIYLNNILWYHIENIKTHNENFKNIIIYSPCPLDDYLVPI